MCPISHRNLELMPTDRGVEVAHTTLFRWIQAYAPEIGSTARRDDRLPPLGQAE
jgi:transposase, IS6 family